MKRLKILCDIDNVLADSDPVFRDIITRVTDGRVRMSVDDFVRYDYTDCPTKTGERLTRAEWDRTHFRFLRYDVCSKVEPMLGVVDYLVGLATNHDLHIATTRPARGWSGTVTWLDRLLGDALYSLHFVKHREKHLIGDFDVAIEDDYDQAVYFAQAGVHCYLIAAPWNINRPPVPGVTWVKDWHQLAERMGLTAAKPEVAVV